MYQQISIAGIETTKPPKKKNPSFRHLVKERIATYGVETITATEILTVLTDIPSDKFGPEFHNGDIIELARRIDSLDITETQRRKLALIFELARKINVARVKEKKPLSDSTTVGNYFCMLLATKAVEEFVVSLLNSKNELIKTVTLSKGTVNETAVYPREVVKHAILNNATSVLLAHNHPANSTKPSPDDISATKNIKAALKTVNINVLDHIIVSGDRYASFAEQGYL
jgi:DNA repair protein RadC